MPTDQLDVFPVFVASNERFLDWEVNHEEHFMSAREAYDAFGGFLSDSNHRREAGVVLFDLAAPDMAQICYLGAFMAKRESHHVAERWPCLEGLLPHDILLEFNQRNPKFQPSNALQRAYRYLEGDLMFMDREITEEDLHRVIMSDASYAGLQQLGEPAEDAPYDVVMDNGIRLAIFRPEYTAKRLQTTESYR